jgi:hypothetical protein
VAKELRDYGIPVEFVDASTTRELTRALAAPAAAVAPVSASAPPVTAGSEQVIEPDRRADEREREDDGQPGQVALDDVLSAVGERGEPHATEAGVPPRVQEREHDQGDREENAPQATTASMGSRMAAGGL